MAVKRKSRVRKPVGFNKHYFIKMALGVVLFTSATVLGLYVQKNWDAAVHNAEEFVAKTVGAKVEHIMVEGLVHADPVELKKALGLQRGESLVGFDSAKVRAQVEGLSWVKMATVERKLPSTVRVELFEYAPLARLQDAEGTFVINKNGDKIDEDASAFTYLPLLLGEGAADKASELFSLLMQSAEISKKLAQAEYIGDRRWNLGFESGVTVQLPERNPSHALSLLSRLNEKRRVLSMEGGMVDLRLEDRIVIRVPEGHKPGEQIL